MGMTGQELLEKYKKRRQANDVPLEEKEAEPTQQTQFTGSQLLENYRRKKLGVATEPSEDEDDILHKEMLTADDFDEYSKLGAEVANPDWKDTFAPLDILGWKPFGEGEKVSNMVTFAEKNGSEAFGDSANALRGGGSTSEYSELINLINTYMRDEEKAIYNYYIGKGETEKAEQYLTELTDSFKKRQAGQMVEQADDTALELVFSAVAGLDQFGSGVKSIDNYITGSDGEATSAIQYAQADMSANNSGIWKVSNDLVMNVGNMAPSMVVGAFTGGLGGALTLGVSAVGNSYSDMRKEGYTANQARAYATLVGASETVLQYALGGISKLGGKVTGGAISKFVSGLDSALAKTAIQLGGSMASEGLEEGIQTALEPAFKALTTGEEYESAEWEEILYSALLGSLSAGVLEGPGTVVGGVKTALNNRELGKQYGGQSQQLIDDALSVQNNSELQSLAEKYKGRVEGGKNLKGGQINRLLEATDTAKLKSAILQRLGELGETSDITPIADVLVRQAMGEELTSRDTNILNNSKAGHTVLTEINKNNIASGALSNKWAENIGTRRISPETYNKPLYDLAQQISGVREAKEQNAVAKNKADFESATGAKFTATESGKTTHEDAEVTIGKVVSTEGGLKVELSNGKTVNASEIEYGSGAEAMMYEMVARMEVPVDTANEILGTFKPTTAKQATMYFNNIPLAYKYGTINYEAGLKNINMSEQEKRIAFNRGKMDAVGKANANTKTASPQSAKTAPTKKNGIIFEGGFTYDESKANELQKVSMAHIEVIDKLSNLEVHVFESKVVDGKRVAYVNGKLVSAPNGYFTDGNKIYIDFHAGNNAEGAMLYTMSHEVTHFIRKWNEKGFKELGDFLIEQYGKNKVSVTHLIEMQKTKIEKRYKEEGKALPSDVKLFDMAYEELVADAMTDMFADPRAYEKLAKLKAQNKTLWQKLGEAIKAVLDKLKSALGIYKTEQNKIAVAQEAHEVRAFSKEVYEKLQDLYIKAFVQADANYSAAEQTLASNGIIVDSTTESASLMSVRDVLDEKQRNEVSKALATRFGVTQEEALQWLTAETSLASLILNPKYSQYLDYTPDPNEVAIKQNSDYPQGTVDFSPICAKRREFTSVMNNILRLFPNHVFAATDLAKIRSIMQEEGMTIPCGICYVEDRRQLDTIVAQNFIDSLKLYRDGSKTRPDGKPFNANQLKGLSLIDGDSYTPSVYELVSLEGLNVLKEKNPNMAEAWIKFNNARGMQSVRLLANEAEYKRQILKYTKATVKAKNDKGGLRVYSFSDAEMFHLIDIIQVITDSATVGLSLQGYTKVNEYARAVKDTGEKLNRSLIPKGELGYHIENGEVVLDYDTVEGIDINHPDFFDNKDNPNVGNITIGVNDTQIRAAMVSDFVDQIIPFHTGQSEEVLGEKGIATWSNYKDFQTEKDIATGKVSDHQINIYTEVLQVLEKEGKPITKRTFVEKFLQVCKENNLTPRFSQFLNTNEKGEYVYTEGYHKMLVDFKTFAQTEVGEYLPQMPVKPIFDNEYITKILKDYVKSQKVKDAELTKSMPKVIERITNEIVNPSETKFSDRDSEGNTLTAEQQEFFKDSKIRDKNGNLMKVYHGSPNKFFTFRQGVAEGWGRGIYFTDNKTAASDFGDNIIEGYLNIKNPFNADTMSYEDIGAENTKAYRDFDMQKWRRYYSEYDTYEEYQEDMVGVGMYEIYTEEVEVFNRILRELGYDGIIANGSNGIDGYEIVAFKENQPKLTTNKNPTFDPDIRYSDRDYFAEDKYFKTQMAKWEDLKHGAYVKVGVIGKTHPLYAVGMPEGILRYDVDKLKRNMADHDDYLDVNLLKAIPDIIGDPIAISEYSEENTVSVFGNVFVGNSPMMVGVTISKDRAGNDISKVRTYNTRRDVGKLITDDTILYLNEDKKRTRKWFQACGIQVPLGETKFGFIRSISQKTKFVNSKLSDRDPNAVSNRTLLANALESVAQNDIEKTKLNQYKAKIALIESEQAKLAEIKEKANKLRFTKGRVSAETKQMRDLDAEANQIANRISTYDKQLLNLESTKALKNVLEREKTMLRRKLEQKGKEALRKQKEQNAKTVREIMTRNTESRLKSVEGRHKTEIRHKIKNVVSDLNKLLLNPTKDQHIPIGLQLPVAEALDAINMDTMNAEQRVAYYNDLIAKSNNPDEIEMLTKKRDFFEYRDANFKERITALKNAYAEFKESDDPLIRNAHNDAIADLIKNTADAVGNKSLKDMSIAQLEAVYNMYKAILATVRNANKLFKEGRQETITDNSEAVKREVREVGGHQEKVLKSAKFFKKFGWDMLKPVTAMKVIGSKTFERLFANVRAAEDTWAVDVSEAKQFYEGTSNKYGFKNWDFKKRYSFKDSAGTNFSLSLEQIMSLYAYSKREQADRHLEDGGFIFDDAIEITEKNKLGIPLKYEVNDANPYRLRKDALLTVTDALTKEQKAFIDEMQTYLSEVMGEKGNEVSLAMYDIKLYNEKNYFPLKTSRYFREFDPEKSGTPKIKNSGFSKKTVPQAGNPIVLANFMDVWASHVNDMSMYHAFVLPLEDLLRVYNYSSVAGGYDSVQQYIKNAYGSQANQYIEKLMDDLNGGARVDSSAGIMNKGISLFKKASVFASASVVVQQPSAIARAMAYINPKYFVTSTPSALNVANHKKQWAEVKKYAPVAVIKEMGYFDTGVGRSTVEWLKGNKTIKDKMDDVLSKAPAIADELVWVHIWEAVKKETSAKNQFKVGSEDFLKECGRRFTEVITNTQVYDSVLSRSGMMRSKDTGMKMATAFMAEPTTTVNMMVDGIIQGKRGNKKFTAATVGAISASVILNSILVALVYAARDDDEDETYTEKYIGSLTSELLDGFNPLTYVPFVKDAWSIAQGYDVERSDMSVVSKLWESIEGLFKDDKSGWEKVLDATGAVSSMFGIPLKNLIRDGRGMYNLTKTILSDTQTTGGGIGDSIEDSFKSSIPLWDRLSGSDSKSDNVYEAIMSGDKVYVERLKKTYKTNDAYETAVRKALRENDSRIGEAAQARLDGDISTYTRIAKEIIAEGYFSQDIVVGAINAEMTAIKKGESSGTEATEEKDEVTSIYSASDINTAFDNGDDAVALEIIDDLINTKVANGMEEKNAKSSVRSSMTSYWKPLYLEAYQSGDSTEMLRIRRILLTSGLYGSASDVVKTVKNWLKS